MSAVSARLGLAKCSAVVCICISALGCAGAKSTVYDSTPIRAVKVWYVGFRYQTGSVEESVSESEGRSSTVIDEGQTPRNLQLRDDIVVYLNEAYGIQASDKPCDSCGLITLHPISDGWGFVTVDALIKDASGRLLARSKVKNGTRNATHMGDDEFGQFTARKLAGLIKD